MDDDGATHHLIQRQPWSNHRAGRRPVGGNNQPPNIELVKTICAQLDELHPAEKSYASLITYVTDRPGHDRRYAIDTSKIVRELGWKARHDLKKGLLNTVEWYLKNTDWVAKITNVKDYQNWMKKNYEKRG